MRVASVTGLALVVLAANPARGDEWSHQYPLKGGAELHVKTDDGSVRIETGVGPEIDARVTTVGWRIAPGEVTITETQTGDRWTSRCGSRRIAPGGEPGTGRSPSPCECPSRPTSRPHRRRQHREPVPAPQLSTGDGASRDGLQGAIRLHTGDGSIRATGLSGRLAADTGDGHMNVRGRFDVLDLRTGDGGIEAAAEAGSKVEAAWSLRSGDGGITLRLPEGFGADLDAHTGDGGIVLDKPVTVTGTISPNTVRGKLGAGGLPLQIHTGDGSIRLMGL